MQNNTETGDWPDKPVELTEDNYDKTVNKFQFVIVDCWAPWCVPCQSISALIDELAKDYAGKIVFGKLNVEDFKAKADDLEIMTIPSILFYDEGLLIDKHTGAVTRNDLEPLVQGLID